MRNDVTCPERQRGSCSRLKSKVAVCSASSRVVGERVSKSTESRARSKAQNKSPEPLLDGPATSEHMSALPSLKFLASGKYNAILDSFVTTTLTMRGQAAKTLFVVVMHKAYSTEIQFFFQSSVA